MPIVTIQLMEGRDREKKHLLIKNVTNAVVDTLNVPSDTVRVILNEMAADHYGVAGMPYFEYKEKKSKEKTDNK